MICDSKSDYFMIQSRKKERILDVIPPIKDFFSIYTTAAFVIPATLYLFKLAMEEKNEKKKLRLKAIKDKEDFTNNSFLEIIKKLEESNKKTIRLEIEQGKMMKKEDADDKFVDNKRFDLNAKAVDERLHKIEETAKENKNDLKKTIDEKTNDLKDFITQSLQLIKKDK
tara:strand:- start:1803 stop:2309 length:507 start_codon:yes stop_codon:yes gene_type:complete